MEGRAGLYKKPFAAYSGALPGAQRLMLSLLFGKGSLHTPLHCRSSCTRALFLAPQLLTKTAETAGAMGGFYFFFLIVFTFFITKISIGAKCCP